MKSKPDTPLWRNGPQEKPVLCNACGSRWRIRGSLENYIPKRGHASRCRRSRKMRDVITDLDAEKNTRMARTEGAKREDKGARMSFGGNPSQTSDESGIWSASRSGLGLVTSDRQNLFDVAIKSGSDDHDEDTIDSGHLKSLTLQMYHTYICVIKYMHLYICYSTLLPAWIFCVLANLNLLRVSDVSGHSMELIHKVSSLIRILNSLMILINSGVLIFVKLANEFLHVMHW